MGFFDQVSVKPNKQQKNVPNPVIPQKEKSVGGFFDMMKEGFSSRFDKFKNELKQSSTPEGIKARKKRAENNKFLIKETIKGLPEATKTEIIQPTLRSYAAVGGFFNKLAGGDYLTPTGTTQKNIYVTDKPITLKSVGAEIGIPESSKFAAPVGFTLGTADLFSGGRASSVVKSLSRLTKESDILKVLLKEFPKLKNSEHLGALKTSISKTKNSDEIKKQIEFAISKVKDTTKNGAGDVKLGVVGKTKLEPTGQIGKDSVGVSRNVTDNTVAKGNVMNKKERGFITSAKKVQPENTKIAGQYVPRSTDKLAIKAKNLIKDNPDEAHSIALNDTGEKAIAVASELMKKYSDDAARATDSIARDFAYDKQAEIANAIAPKLTQLGRDVQAASILGRMTPEGQVRFAARDIQRYNEANPLKKIPGLTSEQAKYITEEMTAINKMPDGLEKSMRFQKLQNKVTDIVPTPLFRKLLTIWKAGLLTGIKTQGLNLFSNAFHGLSEVAKDVPAVAVDKVASLFTGERTKTLTLRKAFDGIKDGTVKGKRYFVTGFDERNIGEKLDYKRVSFGKGKVADAFKVYTGVVFRSLGTGDQPFYYAALSRSLMDQALAKGMNTGLKGKKLVKYAYDIVENPTEDMIRYAVSDATTAVFQNKTALGNVASKIQKSSKITQILLPFARTPSAVAMQIINYSPVGIAKTIIENIGKGKFDQRLFSQGIGRGLTGTAVIAIGMEIAKKGLISEDYPRGDKRQQELDKAEGRTNNSIKIGDKWISPIVFGPAGNLLIIGGHIQRALDKKGSPTEAMGTAMIKIAKSFTEQTFLTGVKNFIDGVSEPDTFVTRYLPNLIASGVPTIVSDVARSIDPLERRSSGFKEKVQQRIPVLRNKLEPQVTAFGQEKKRASNPLDTMINPLRPSTDTETEVTKELRRLTEAGFKVSPTKVGKKEGYSVLSKEENTQLWKLTGSIVDGKLRLVMAMPTYKKMSDEQKKKAIDMVVGRSKDFGRASYVLKLTQGLEGEMLKNKLIELRDGGLLTRDVLRAYLKIK